MANRRPAYPQQGPSHHSVMFEGQPLFGTALSAALGNTHPSQMHTPPPRLPGTYPAHGHPPHAMHVHRPSLAQFVPSSIPVLPLGFPPIPGALLNPNGMPVPMPMAMSMPVPMQGGMQNQFQRVSPMPHTRSPSQLHIPNASPVYGHNRSPSQMAAPSPTSNFVPRSRRQPSIGGPPKAVLGGPQRKVSPMPPISAAVSLPSVHEKPKTYTVALPLESGEDEVTGDEGAEPREAKDENEDDTENPTKGRERSLWSRPTPISAEEADARDLEIVWPDAKSIDVPDEEAFEGPFTAWLPAYNAWERYKQQMVDSKLASLGYVEPSMPMEMPIPVPALLGPGHSHARALSMASSFSPGLLQYKLAKLSPSVASISPLDSPAIQNPRPTHHTSLSLSAAAPEYFPRLGMDSLTEEHEEEEEIEEPAPLQPDEADVLDASVAEMPKTSEDFVRGFGLDLTSESEDGGEHRLEQQDVEDISGLSIYHDGEPNLSITSSTFSTAPEPDLADLDQADVDYDQDEFDEYEDEDHEREDLSDGRGDEEEDEDDLQTLGTHTRNPTITDFGTAQDIPVDLTDIGMQMLSAGSAEPREGDEAGTVGDWTGSEDLRTGEEELEDVPEDDLSDSVWSNPSDEERARQERIHKRMLRAHAVSIPPLPEPRSPSFDSPRRLPNFPQPPVEPDLSYLSTQRSERSEVSFLPTQRSEQSFSQGDTSEVISNPSEEATRSPAMSNMAHEGDPGEMERIYAQSHGYPIPFAPIPYPTHGHSPHASITLSASYATADGTPDGPVGSSALNPQAKPFVFGAAHTRPDSFSGRSSLHALSPPVSYIPSATEPHTRHGSITRLNAQAAEFRPSFSLPGSLSGTTFSFQPPPQAPSLHFAAEDGDAGDDVEYPVQGRKKRRRRSQEDLEDEEEEEDEELSDSEGEKENLTTFQFPPPVSTYPDHEEERLRESRRLTQLNATAAPFVFDPSRSLLSSAAAMPVPLVSVMPEPEHRQVTATVEFNHPVSTTKVRASLFKSLNTYGGDGESSRGRRSRISSRDYTTTNDRRSVDEDEDTSSSIEPKASASLAVDIFFEDEIGLDGSRSRSSSRAPLHVRQPHSSSPQPAPTLLGPPSVLHRATSLPALRSETPSTNSHNDVADSRQSRQTADHFEELERRIHELLHDKLDSVRADLVNVVAHSQLSSAPLWEVDGMIDRIASTVEMRIREHIRPGDSSLRDASGEFDFDLLRTVIAETHEPLREHLIAEISAFCRQFLLQTKGEGSGVPEITRVVEEASARDSSVLASAVNGFQDITARLNDLSLTISDQERERLLSDVSELLLPQIASLRAEPLDVDALTEQLSEAVKPHISQLIDLASDKKETAVLIVQRLGPLLTSLMPPPVDVAAITQQIAAYIERLMPQPFDTEVLRDSIIARVKEGVSGELGKQMENIPTAILAGVSELVEPIMALRELLPLAETFQAFTSHQEKLNLGAEQVVAQHEKLVSELSPLTSSVGAAVEILRDVREQLNSGSKAFEGLQELQTALTANADLQAKLSEAQAALLEMTSEKMSVERDIASLRLDRDALLGERQSLQSAHEFHLHQLDEKDKFQKQLQSQLAFVQAELASVNEKSAAFQVTSSEVTKEKAGLNETALRLKAQVSKLEKEGSRTSNDLEATRASLDRLQKEHDELKSQQTQWTDLRKTAEQVEALTRLISAAEEEEVKELKQVRDRSKVMEGELASLRKRYEEQEAKLANLQRTSIASKNSMAAMQQRATEWEKKARAAESEAASLKSERETAESLRRQLESDYSMLQQRQEELEQLESESRSREAAMQEELDRLRQQVDYYVQADNPLLFGSISSHEQPLLNGSAHPYASPSQTHYAQPSSRPASATSSASYHVVDVPDRTSNQTPQPQQQPQQPLQGVWASIHAPAQEPGTPRPYSRAMSSLSMSSAGRRSASPALSTVSVTPTEQDDGWWA